MEETRTRPEGEAATGTAPPADAAGSLAGRRVLVMGLGSFGGGLGVTRWLVREGARVTVTDLRGPELLGPALGALEGLPVELALGGHRACDFHAAEVVVANPAVPPASPWLGLAREGGARVTSEIELFLRRVRGRVLAVTGTQGKSSTASMTHQLLVGAGRRAHLGGNIGGSLLESLDAIGPEDAVVLELSSYQLDALEAPAALGARVDAVAITNVLQDHLERHGDERAYREAKARILALVAGGGAALVPRADADLRARAPGALLHGTEAEATEGLRLAEGRFLAGDELLGRVEDLRLPGAFQVANALVALGLARRAGVPAETLAALVPTLRGLPHRMQPLGTVRGVRVIDNGVSTTPDSTVAVLADVPPGTTLLVGGQAKRLSFDELAEEARARALRVVAFGASAADLAARFRAHGAGVEEHAGLPGAVAAALAGTPAGGTLLFSPACASFDAFPNFRARAERFHALLEELR